MERRGNLIQEDIQPSFEVVQLEAGLGSLPQWIHQCLVLSLFDPGGCSVSVWWICH